jgi:hypothetical protein
MTTDEQMTIDERYKYLRMMQKRYRKATTRQEKHELLNEMEAMTTLHRKYLIQLMGSTIKRKPRSRERDVTYGPEVDEALTLIWETLDYICPERLTDNLVETAEILAHHDEMYLAPTLRAQLKTISISTVRRHLPPKPLAVQRRLRPRAKNTLQQKIPARRIPWDTPDPGHFEMDLVHHSGPQPEGEYGYTLQLIDVATGWSARRAILGRSYVVMADALFDLFQHLPFPVKELHPDNGGEFINHHLERYLDHFYPHIEFSRSRVARPNDNRFVEQKNDTLVRHFFGDRRLDTVTQIRYLNRLYGWLTPYYNYFQPVMHMIAKIRVPATDQRSSYIRRIYDTPRPPLTRLFKTETLDPELCRRLTQHKRDINPRILRDQIYAGIDQLFRFPLAESGKPQNVYQILARPDLFPAAFTAIDMIEASDPTTYIPSLPPLEDLITHSHIPSQRKEKVIALQ